MAKRTITTTTTPKEGDGNRRHFDPSFKHEAVALGKRIGIRQAAQDLGIGESNLRNWTQAVSTRGSQAFAPVSQRTDVDAELRRLREQVRVLQMERDILKKSGCILREGMRVRYRFIAAHVESWPVTVQCRVLGLQPSGYYAWKKRPNARRHELDDRFSDIIRRTFEQHHGNYGVPRITEELRALGHRINRKRVERLMREMGLQAKQRQKFRPRTTVVDAEATISPDLFGQDFTAEQPNQRWVGDITYLETSSGFEYLATVIDLYSRRVVGWALSQTLETIVVLEAMDMALRQRRPPPGLIFHSDRGCQYTSQAFRDRLRLAGIQQSMSRSGCCYDNAAAESFFHSLKVEWLHGHEVRDRETIRNEVFSYIEGYYNRSRRHSSIGYLSPIAFENSRDGAA